MKQALNHGLMLDKVHRIIEFNQKDWLKLYIDTNTELRPKTRNDFEKGFFELLNNSVFGKTAENVRNNRGIKFVTTDERRKKLVSRASYHRTECFSEKLLTTEMRKKEVKMDKPVYLGLSILNISKIAMYDTLLDTGNFIVHENRRHFCRH